MSIRGAYPGAGDEPDVATVARNGHRAPCSCEAVPVPGDGEEIVVLRLAGEIDLVGYPMLAEALAGSLRAAPRHLVVDLAAVTFCGVRGFCMLGDAAATAAVGGTAYAISGIRGGLDHIAVLLWEDTGPTRYRTEAGAVTAIRAGRAERR